MIARGIYTVERHPYAFIVVLSDCPDHGYVPAVRVDYPPSFRAIPILVGAAALKPYTLPVPEEARIWEAAAAAQRTALTPIPLPGGSTRLA